MKDLRGYLIVYLFLASASADAQTPLFYQSNYLRVVQPDVDDASSKYVIYDKPGQKFDTLLNPFTGGLNNPVFYNIDLNGDGIQDLFVFDRELLENQFLLFQADNKYSTQYRFSPQYESFFPKSMSIWTVLADYNKDGLPDIFTASDSINTGMMVFKNTSGFDPLTHQYKIQFQKAADTLFFYCNNTKQPINISTTSNPQIVDIDNDGYLDILAFDPGLSQVMFFRNRAKGRDSLSFYFTKACWGYFEESLEHLYSPWDCESAIHSISCDPGYHKSGSRIFNSMCAMDVEPDGDIDLLLGDGLNDSLAFLKNGKNIYGTDTMINISYRHDNDSFPIDEPAVIPTMPTASNLDIDHDNLKDLVVAAGQPTYLDSFSNSRLHNIWYYNNEGDSVTPVNIFKLKTKDFLQNTMVDWGINSAPCFIDVDKDGRKDLIIAVKDGGDSSGFSHCILYLNKAGQTPGSKPYLLYQTNDYLGFSSLKVPVKSPIPTGYLNSKDGKTDLIFGNDSGRIMYFKDLSSGKKPADFKLVQSSLQYVSNGQLLPIWVGRNSAPAAVDINHDGKTDLLIGSNNGTISYYRCQGYGPAPDYIPYFVLVTSVFGNINEHPGIDGQLAPCVADLDKDGKPDLLTGDRFGNLFYYHDFDTVSTLIPSNQSLVYDYGTGKRSTGKLFSTYTVPAVAYLDQDTFPDIILGCRRGGLFFLGSADNPIENLGIPEPEPSGSVYMKIFPNPARDKFSIQYDNIGGPQNSELMVTDILGKQLLKKPFILNNGKGSQTIETAGFSGGVYLINVIAGGTILYSDKLIILRQ